MTCSKNVLKHCVLRVGWGLYAQVDLCLLTKGMKLWIPVICRPRINACTSWVPS